MPIELSAGYLAPVENNKGVVRLKNELAVRIGTVVLRSIGDWSTCKPTILLSASQFLIGSPHQETFKEQSRKYWVEL